VSRTVAAPKQVPVICVVASLPGTYSETFIQAHIERLPAHVEPIYLHGVGWQKGDGQPLLNPLLRSAAAVAREFNVDFEALQAWALYRYLKRHRVQAVLAEYGVNGARVFRVCRRAGIPLVVHFHGFDAYKHGRLAQVSPAYAEMFGMVAAVVAVSHDMEKQLATLGAPRDKIVYCPCGVDLASFSGADPASAPPTFLAVGRFVEKKAPHLTLLAFRKVVDAFPEARLIMAGTGTLHQACMQLAAGLRLSEHVSFRGVISHREVAALMQRVRGFVQHSIRPEDGDSEGTPVAVIEAGAAGLPVVATAHGGIGDVIVHGETGFLVREGDIDAMADYMIQLASDAALAARLGRQARARVAAQFSLDTSIARLWSVLDRAIAEPSVVVQPAHTVVARPDGAPEVP